MRTLVQDDHYRYRYSPEIGSIWQLRPGEKASAKFDKVVVSRVKQPMVELLCLDGSTHEVKVVDLSWFWKQIA